MADTFWIERLEATKLRLIEVETTLSGLNDGVQTMSLDTSQSRVSKTRFEIASMTRIRDQLLNEISVLEVRIGRGGSFYGRNFRC